jgi:transposase
VWNAIQYRAATGCQWALLPKDFPPFTTVLDCAPFVGQFQARVFIGARADWSSNWLGLR